MATELTVKPLPFTEAIEFFRGKGYALSPESWRDIWQEAHARAFTVARVTAMDVLADIRKELEKAIASGTTLREFQHNLIPLLRKKGWFARSGIDAETGERKRLTPWRLKTIFQTNIQSAYQVGRYRQMMEVSDRRPYWMYDAINDASTRPAHLAMDGRVYHYRHPIWQRWYPPNGFNCRCSVRALSERQLQRKGLTEEIHPPPGNPMPDEGWRYNVGEAGLSAWRPDLKRYPPGMGGAVKRDLDRLEKWRRGGFFPEDLTAVPDTRKGSNPGGVYRDPLGREYYVKFYGNLDQARTEYAANRLYSRLGVGVPEIRLAEMADPDGKKRLAVITDWMDDLAPLDLNDLGRYREALARIHQASALLSNWDVVGLEYDNILIDRNGRLVVIDSGGSLRFRAMGGSKPFGNDPTEDIRNLMDPTSHRPAARVFSRIYQEDVFLEAEGARPIATLTRKEVDNLFKEAGFRPRKGLVETLLARKKAFIDRYNLKGAYTPKGFGKHLEKFKEWGTSAFEVRVAANGAVYSRQLKDEAQALTARFGAYVRENVYPKGDQVLQGVFKAWSDNSTSAKGGAVLKKWAEKRFGFTTTYHKGDLERDFKGALAYFKNQFGVSERSLFNLLDAEYEFHQYKMRRLHRYETVVVERDCGSNEFRRAVRGRSKVGDRITFQPNSVSSTTTGRRVFNHKSHRIRADVRVEDVVKTWNQGAGYMHYYDRELEYILLGRPSSWQGVERLK